MPRVYASKPLLLVTTVACVIDAPVSAQEIAERERELREEEAAELARVRHEAARRKVEGDAKRKADEVEAKFLKEMQIAQAMEVKNRYFAVGLSKYCCLTDFTFLRSCCRRFVGIALIARFGKGPFTHRGLVQRRTGSTSRAKTPTLPNKGIEPK